MTYLYFYLWGLENNQHNRWPLFYQSCGAQHCDQYLRCMMHPTRYNFITLKPLVDLNEFTSIFQTVKHSHYRHQKTTSNILRINLKGKFRFINSWPPEGDMYINLYKAHLHWQKPKSKKSGFFVVPFTLPEKPIAFGVFGTKSACTKKPESHTCVFVSGAHARLLSTFDRTRVVRITSQAAVGWFRWRSCTTRPKTRIPARLERAFTLAKNQWNFGGVLKKTRCGGGFFDSGFLECIGEVA